MIESNKNDFIKNSKRLSLSLIYKYKYCLIFVPV